MLILPYLEKAAAQLPSSDDTFTMRAPLLEKKLESLDYKHGPDDVDGEGLCQNLSRDCGRVVVPEIDACYDKDVSQSTHWAPLRVAQAHQRC